MKLWTIVGRSFTLSYKVWFETLVLSVFLIPVFWLGMEALVQFKVGLSRLLLLIPHVLFTALSGAILFHAFERITHGNQEEIPLDEFVRISGLLIGATFIVEIIVSIGWMFCVVPGVIAFIALSLTQASVFIQRHGILQAIDDSFTKTKGYRIEIFLVKLALYAMAISTLLFSIIVLNETVENHNVDGAGLVAQYSMFAKVLWAVAMGLVGASVGTFSRALEYAVYTEIRQTERLPPLELKPDYQLISPPRQPLPPVRPIDVGPDIVFGAPSDDDI